MSKLADLHIKAAPHGELLQTVGAAAVVVAFCSLLLLRDPNLFLHDDWPMYFLAGYWDSAHSWSQGEWPLLSPYSWFGGALAGEYQYGTFSIFITLCIFLIAHVHLTLPVAAALHAIIHLSVLAMGAFWLARQRQLSSDL